MTTKEKVKFIINDYMAVIDSMDSMPREQMLARKWFDETFRPAQDAFVKKYSSNSMHQFASRLAVLYGDEVEREFKELFTPPEQMKQLAT